MFRHLVLLTRSPNTPDTAHREIQDQVWSCQGILETVWCCRSLGAGLRNPALEYTHPDSWQTLEKVQGTILTIVLLHHKERKLLVTQMV